MKYLMGIDLGSTTAKIAVLDEKFNLLYSRYIRHRARVKEVLLGELKKYENILNDKVIKVAFTGSAAMELCDDLGLPFVQEVVAATQYIKHNYPEVRTFVDIGGEDSKIVFFDTQFRPDMRMNGACAGGTGAFIDQMATLLGVSLEEMDDLANNAKNIYPIASRCGVFAKTDVQALISRKVSKEDIVKSIFYSVVLQVISSLSRGKQIEKKVALAGGPLSFLKNLQKTFLEITGLDEKDLIIDDTPHLIPAKGSILLHNQIKEWSFTDLVDLLENNLNKAQVFVTKGLPPLFNSIDEYKIWEKKHNKYTIQKVYEKLKIDGNLFLGIDSGSTTTKMVVIDEEAKIVAKYYTSNSGDPIDAIRRGAKSLLKKLNELGISSKIACSAATGYGEALIRSAFQIHLGIVETMAHFKAASFFEPDVSFILDIGGQDMKAIKIENGFVTDIQLNEACSSGCGSFIETFAKSLGYSVEEFAKIGVESRSPYDLGTRCTVFMNSKVKQAQSEGASVSDISAGLAYSVIKNALYKVLKLKDTSYLGDKIVVQGGTFKNPLVLRALEIIVGKEVIRPDIVELMGAYGAALYSLQEYKKDKRRFSQLDLSIFQNRINYQQSVLHCKGCENSCEVIRLKFNNNNNTFFTGNRCERIFSNDSLKGNKKGTNLIEEQRKLLFDRDFNPKTEPILTYGIPRVLNMYEDFPFWCTFLTSLGFKVVLSSPSSFSLFEKGIYSVMSENICFPAKLTHGHIVDLLEKKVDKIFYPIVVHEQKEFDDSINSYNCPVVTGYPDVIKSAINPKQYGIEIDSPQVSFRDRDLLIDQLFMFFKKYNISYRQVYGAFKKAMRAQQEYRTKLQKLGEVLIKKSLESHEKLVILMGRPYHIDPLVNHGIDILLSNLGCNVMSERAYPIKDDLSLKDIEVLTQWEYSNILYAVAQKIPDNINIDCVHLTSFGCGPDAIVCDEIKDIFRKKYKIYTLIKMDEIANLGAIKIRLRSMLESEKVKTNRKNTKENNFKKKITIFEKKDKDRVLIVPYFSPFYSPLIPYGFRPYGYTAYVLPPQSQNSVEWGIRSINNDMCYPAILVAGDIIWAFKTGKFEPSKTAVILTQTGGQCRASNYVALVRKALCSMGYEDVPIISISNEEMNPQPGFDIDKESFYKRLGMGIIFGDCLARMYLASAPREKVKGSAKYLHEKYLKKIGEGIERGDFDYLLKILQMAVDEFNCLPVEEVYLPKIGIVGEIFVKYNFFSNKNIVEWLTSKGVEVELPPIQNFFAQRFINEAYNQRALFKKSFKDLFKHWVLELYSKFYLHKVERIYSRFRFAQKDLSLRKLATLTEEIVSLANQAGEGWLLTAEMISMLKRGVNNIICLQPFGCISNHITGKGIENRLKEAFPELNLLAIDLDSGTSGVNVLNRIHIMLTSVKEIEHKKEKRSVFRFDMNMIPKIWIYDMWAINNHISVDIEKWKAWMWKIRPWEKIKTIKR